jgi:hypothetical protein
MDADPHLPIKMSVDQGRGHLEPAAHRMRYCCFPRLSGPNVRKLPVTTAEGRNARSHES